MQKGSTIIFTLSVCLGIFYLTGCQNNPATPWQEELSSCQQENKYTVILVADSKSEEAESIEEILDETAAEHTDQMKLLKVDYQKEKDSIFNRFKLQKFNELPATLIIAPNGALINIFGKKVDKASIERSFISSQEADLILSLQKGQVVFLCLFDNDTSELDGVRSELSAIETYFKGMATVMYVDIGTSEEASLIEKLPDFNPITVLTLVPPGQIVSKLEGAQITRQNMLQTLLSACGAGGCGPSGCN